MRWWTVLGTLCSNWRTGRASATHSLALALGKHFTLDLCMPYSLEEQKYHGALLLYDAIEQLRPKGSTSYIVSLKQRGKRNRYLATTSLDSWSWLHLVSHVNIALKAASILFQAPCCGNFPCRLHAADVGTPPLLT